MQTKHLSLPPSLSLSLINVVRHPNRDIHPSLSLCAAIIGDRVVSLLRLERVPDDGKPHDPSRNPRPMLNALFSLGGEMFTGPLFRVDGVEHMLSDDMLRTVDWYRRNHSVCSIYISLSLSLSLSM